jgi:D-alanine-D-alanine ligase
VRPAVMFGGPSPEHDISILTGLQAARALVDAGHDVEAIYWSKAGDFHGVAPDLEAAAFLEGVPAKASRLELVAGAGFSAEARMGRRRPLEISAVLNCCHGGPGEDGTLQAAFDLAGLRYTGPTAPGAALGMDKLAFGGVCAAAGLPTLPRMVLTADGPAPDFEGPYIVKPRFGGSSMGIEADVDAGTARDLVRTQPLLRAGAIIEQYRPDAADLNISLRTYPALQLSAIEKPLRAPDGRIYTYAEKYLGGEGLTSAPRELPADVPDDVRKRMEHAARTIANVAGVRGVPRIDFLWVEDELYVNEINTIPGALAWYFWALEGVPFVQLLTDMLAEAERSPGPQWTSEGADGSALRAAGSIAGKLA